MIPATTKVAATALIAAGIAMSGYASGNSAGTAQGGSGAFGGRVREVRPIEYDLDAAGRGGLRQIACPSSAAPGTGCYVRGR